MPFLNDTQDGYNNTKKIITFINPDTMTVVSQITWEGTLINSDRYTEENYFNGPLTETQKGWQYPYYYLIGETIDEISSTFDKGIYITTINNLKNGNTSSIWMVSNLTFISTTNMLFQNHWNEWDAQLTYNQSGHIAGFTFGFFIKDELDSAIPEENRLDYSTTPWFVQPNYTGVIASRIASYNFENAS